MRLSIWNRVLSYLMPITRKVESNYTKSAELNLINGRYTLDTANANYSYGSLQRILNVGLQNAELASAESILGRLSRAIATVITRESGF